MTEITLKSWGREELIYNHLYCCKLLVYDREGIASSLHFHRLKTETFIVTSGEFLIEWALVNMLGESQADSKQTEYFEPGRSINLAPYTAHRIRCIKKGVIVEASTRDDETDCVRIEPSES